MVYFFYLEDDLYDHNKPKITGAELKRMFSISEKMKEMDILHLAELATTKYGKNSFSESNAYIEGYKDCMRDLKATPLLPGHTLYMSGPRKEPDILISDEAVIDLSGEEKYFYKMPLMIHG
jgi:hypothetical protein